PSSSTACATRAPTTSTRSPQRCAPPTGAHSDETKKKVHRGGLPFVPRLPRLSASVLRPPRTTLGDGFDLLASRARCTRKPRDRPERIQECPKRKFAKTARFRNRLPARVVELIAGRSPWLCEPAPPD